MSELLDALEQDRAAVAGDAERKPVGRPRKAKAKVKAGSGRRNDPYETPAEDCERIVQKSPCGWCGDGLHESCMIETQPWYGRIWVCGCPCLSSRAPEGDTVTGDAEASEPEGITSYEHPGLEGVLDSLD